jgi:two-component system LytT family response regulator
VQHASQVEGQSDVELLNTIEYLRLCTTSLFDLHICRRTELSDSVRTRKEDHSNNAAPGRRKGVRVVVVEDAPPEGDGVRAHLSRIPDVEVVADCCTGKQAVTAICDLSPDLVVLDVRLPDLSGFDVLRKIPDAKRPLVIVLTADDHCAAEAYNVHALDYLVKPIDDIRFTQALERARTQMRNATAHEIACRIRELLQPLDKRDARAAYETRFAVRTGRRIAIIPVEDIDWIEATGDYVTLHVGKHTHLLRQTMSRLEFQLDPDDFIRVHRSVIVHASRICELEMLPNREYLLRLTDGTKLRTSRRFSDRIARWL